jgi:hypothetical protein
MLIRFFVHRESLKVINDYNVNIGTLESYRVFQIRLIFMILISFMKITRLWNVHNDNLQLKISIKNPTYQIQNILRTTWIHLIPKLGRLEVEQKKFVYEFFFKQKRFLYEVIFVLYEFFFKRKNNSLNFTRYKVMRKNKFRKYNLNSKQRRRKVSLMNHLT